MNPINDPTLPPAALRAFYLKALEHPAFVDELTTYQVSELLKYAKDIYWQACELAANLLDNSTDYPYPEEFKGGKEYDYWLERQSAGTESQKVQALCARRLDAAPPALTTPTAPATTESLDTPAAFWEALRRMPMEVEWVNDSPRYTVPVHLLDYEDFNEDLRPLREAFEAALPKLKTKHLRLLHHDLSELLGIDRQSFRRREALYNERNYALHFLPDNYPILRFEVAEPGRGLASPWQWVNPSIWTGFVVLMQYKQEVARAIYDKISAALDKPPYPFPTTAPHPGSPAPDKGCPHLGDTLDTAAAAVWTSLLCKNVAYTLADLDGLLVSLGLLTDAASRTPTADFKGSAVLGAVKALRERRYLKNNNAKLARLLTERYGDEAANPHTMKRGTNQLPDTVSHVYTLALALLPAP